MLLSTCTCNNPEELHTCKHRDIFAHTKTNTAYKLVSTTHTHTHTQAPATFSARMGVEAGRCVSAEEDSSSESDDSELLLLSSFADLFPALLVVTACICCRLSLSSCCISRRRSFLPIIPFILLYKPQKVPASFLVRYLDRFVRFETSPTPLTTRSTRLWIEKSRVVARQKFSVPQQFIGAKIGTISRMFALLLDCPAHSAPDTGHCKSLPLVYTHAHMHTCTRKHTRKHTHAHTQRTL